MRAHNYYVYILTNRSRTLYIGVTNDVARRLSEHRARPRGAFCTRYNIDTLVYVERFQWIQDAIRREKELKRWSRAKKVWLVQGANPQWHDLSAEYGDPLAPESTDGDPPGPDVTNGDPSGPIATDGDSSGPHVTNGDPSGPHLTNGDPSGPHLTNGDPSGPHVTNGDPSGPEGPSG